MQEQVFSIDHSTEKEPIDSITTPTVDALSHEFNRDFFAANDEQKDPDELPVLELVDLSDSDDETRLTPQMELLGEDVARAYELLVDGSAAFYEIDSNGDGLITTAELEQYIEAGSKATEPVSEHERRKLDAASQMLLDFQSLKDASNDEWGSESGITLVDLECNFQDVIWRDQEEIMNRLENSVRGGNSGFIESREDLLSRTQIVSDLDNRLLASRLDQPLFPLFIVSLYDQNRGIRFRYSSNDGVKVENR